ncbi:MAG TPA: ankyrin repeat domain-containing protein [Pyrinomonadaceae bacterium]|nr:ankyrin repeat domain-containing protein [Pyrinomonadaceae bacterium]
MSATVRQFNRPDVSAELLRVAEGGDVDELLRLLPRVGDINARNRHGMTALMKAAFFGHEPVLRVLLEHGADPNVARNDRFTALALAAFFGHSEAVKTLIEFGAKTETVTRAGASARTWARIRTFDEIARCLESHAPKPVVAPKAVAVAPAPAIEAPAPVAVTPAAVLTLKDPPEIWDLVHEVPRGFDPRSAFIARITSMRKTFVVGACAAVLLIVGAGVGVLMLRKPHARVLPAEVPPPAPVARETVVSDPPQSQPVVESPPVEVVNGNHSRAVPNKARLWIRQPRTAPVSNEVVSEAPAEPVAAPQIESQKPAPPTVKSNPNVALSPQVITPSKSAPPKGKVIQWP